MTRIALPLLLLLFLAFGIGACDDDPTTPSGNDSTSSKVTATISGAAFVSDSAQGIFKNGFLSFEGRESDGLLRQISISSAVDGPGSYTLTGLVASAFYREVTGGTATNFSQVTTGTLVVEEIDDYGAKGTFSFTAREAVTGGGSGAIRTITGGTFDIRF